MTVLVVLLAVVTVTLLVNRIVRYHQHRREWAGVYAMERWRSRLRRG